jgi:hypothetical protein
MIHRRDKDSKDKKKKDKDKIIFDNDIQDKVFVFISYLIMMDKKNKI